MGFGQEGDRLRSVWQQLYNPNRFHRLPARLLTTSELLIPHLVDEIAYQTRRNLAQQALADIIPFSEDDEKAIQAGARQLVQGGVPPDLPPRFLVSAASYALATGQIPARQLANRVINHLTSPIPPSSPSFKEIQAALL
jgi:hypothetical protein